MRKLRNLRYSATAVAAMGLLMSVLGAGFKWW